MGPGADAARGKGARKRAVNSISETSLVPRARLASCTRVGGDAELARRRDHIVDADALHDLGRDRC